METHVGRYLHPEKNGPPIAANPMPTKSNASWIYRSSSSGGMGARENCVQFHTLAQPPLAKSSTSRLSLAVVGALSRIRITGLPHFLSICDYLLWAEKGANQTATYRTNPANTGRNHATKIGARCAAAPDLGGQVVAVSGPQ